MDPQTTASHYDRIAEFIRDQTSPDYGLDALRRALRFCAGRGAALDVGCGPTGRFMRYLAGEGFAAEGLDVSARMVALAREAMPGVPIHHADICAWLPVRSYDLITAWDSTFHLPLAEQEPVLRKLCAALAPGGALLFTAGGGEPGEIVGEMQGLAFGYSTIGVANLVRIIAEERCECRHVEYDQWPERHVVVIAQRVG